MEENTKTPLDVQLDQILKDKFSFTFETSKSGIYFVEITASAKNKKQNIYPEWAWRIPPLPVQAIKGRGDDDDLYVRIDGQEFPKLGGVRGLRNAPAAWSGAALKNTSKTNVFVLFLEKGSHTLTFHPEGSPTLQKISCEKLKSPQSFNYPLKYNNPSDKKERSPWYTFALADLPLIQIDINATVAKRKKWLFFSEDDDLKIALNGDIQENKKENAHKKWFFCARAQEGSASFSGKPRWKPKLHYIELFADWTPQLEKVYFGILQIYKPYQDRDYNRYDKEILEAATYWNRFFLGQRYPPPEPLDPNLIKAIIYQESKVGYTPGGEVDVMQVGNIEDPALHVLNNDHYVNRQGIEYETEYEFVTGEEKALDYNGGANAKTPEQSIFWGIRWLYHKLQPKGLRTGGPEFPLKPDWVSWREAVFGYGPNTEGYTKSVWDLYTKGVNPEGGDPLFTL